MRRVVITGIGMVSPLGANVKTTWQNLIASKSGLVQIDKFDATDWPCRVAGQLPVGTQDGAFNPDLYLSTKDQRKVDPFISYGIAAATQAIEDAGWKPEDEESQVRTGVMIGSGIGGLTRIQEAAKTMLEQGPRRVTPFFIPSCLINLASGHVSIKYGFKGPNHSVVTACSTSANAIGDASRLIQYGDADVMIAGGAEAAINELGICGFAAMKALSTSFNDTPERASRPWDRDRDGFVMGEGAGVVVLEELEHAKKRGAKIYAELVGYGLSGDAHHVTAPHPEGDGAFRSMQAAIRNAKLSPEDVDYVNAHGTSTPMGDEIELGAVKRLMGSHSEHVSMSSTKSSIGHLLGAAGAVESIFCIMGIVDGIMPPTLNLDNVDDTCKGIDLIPHKAKEKKVKVALSNSFGFGGTNASLVFKAFS
ncbi:MAG: beta-ketoacyl-ACP synthase II [Candidatus Paracaedimonas acanthamoebae]|uniref:3-oxoacyl-[acyl-carrier-protein] synthase 2 n=1 Tax=Candidatus Paracaedimonas acanthamoebae TaxID=244581 RepID=A0A8J7PGG9_9PROT|nr:beta-ketoacyl-ACP synthase II [Candidatus Paracaedimonas acanthamoebae]